MRKLIFLTLLFFFTDGMAQDPPSGYTNNYRFRMWAEGAYPTADSVNRNLVDIDSTIKKRDLRIDSLKNAFTWFFNFPTVTWKRYDNTEFDNDTLKVKSGVFPKLTTANTYTTLQTFLGGEIKFQQDFGTTLNFVYDNDLGGVFIKKNNNTTLLKFDEDDGLYWQTDYPIISQGSIDGSSIKIGGTALAIIDTNQLWHKWQIDTSKYFLKKDSLNFGSLKRTQTWTGANTFNGITYTGTIETGNTTVTGSLDVNSTSTFSSDVTMNDDLTVTNRLHTTQGSNIAISDSITLPSNGNSFLVTGTGTLNRIKTTSWQNGDVIHLVFSVATNQVNTIGSTGLDFPGCIHARSDIITDAYQVYSFVLINQRWYSIQY